MDAAADRSRPRPSAAAGADSLLYQTAIARSFGPPLRVSAPPLCAGGRRRSCRGTPAAQEDGHRLLDPGPVQPDCWVGGHDFPIENDNKNVCNPLNREYESRFHDRGTHFGSVKKRGET